MVVIVHPLSQRRAPLERLHLSVLRQTSSDTCAGRRTSCSDQVLPTRLASSKSFVHYNWRRQERVRSEWVASPACGPCGRSRGTPPGSFARVDFSGEAHNGCRVLNVIARPRPSKPSWNSIHRTVGSTNIANMESKSCCRLLCLSVFLFALATGASHLFYRVTGSPSEVRLRERSC